MNENEAFKYCLVCGSKFEEINEVQKKCPSCGYNYFLHANPSASALILNSKNEALLIRRAREPFKGTLDTPGGFSEYLETTEEALVREIKEEVGIEIKNYQYYKSYNGDYPYKGITKRYLVSIFVARIDDNEKLIAGDDAGDAKFYNLQSLEIDLEVKSKTTNQFLKDYLLDLKNGKKF